MRCKRVFALVCLSACLTACGNNIANEQNDGADYWDADGNPITFNETVGKGYETTAAEESETDTVTETVQFHDQIIEKSKLSQETIEWLEWYNSLSAEGQMAINYIPHDLYEFLDYSEDKEVVAEETDSSITDIDAKEYLKVSDLKPNIAINTQDLICFNGEVYGRSFKLIDYAGGSEPVGTISSLISSDLVPQFDGETNQEYLLNASIYESTSYSAVVKCNGVYILFESINSEQNPQSEVKPTIEELIKSNPNIIGVVEEVHDNYIILYSETMDGYPNGSRWSIPLNAENTDSYTDIAVGDEIVVCYDGMALETSPLYLQVRTVYTIALKSDIDHLL